MPAKRGPRKVAERPEPSTFAQLLRKITDEFEFIPAILRVTPRKHADWLNDRSLPSPENLRSIKAILSSSTKGVPLLEEFNRVMNAPARQVTPHWKKIGPSLAHYGLADKRRNLLAQFSAISPRLQEELSVEFTEIIDRRCLEEQGTRANSM